MIEIAGVIGIAFISIPVTLMLYPFAGWKEYLDYHPLLYILGVSFMPLFIYISVILQSQWDINLRMLLLAIGFIGFWGSAAWLSSEKTRGRHVEGLLITEDIVFRPDIVLPQGVLLVKSIILIGMGFMIASQEVTRLPIWNWSGFLVAFWGIITLVPVRGMVKLFFGRRYRMLGRPFGSSLTYHSSVFLITIIGLVILMYGFLNAFMGRNPFDSTRLVVQEAKQIEGGLIFIISLIILFIHETIIKTKNPDVINNYRMRLPQDVTLIVGILVLIYGFITSFMGRWMYPQFKLNPNGALYGAAILISGVLLLLFYRPQSNYSDYFHTIKIMTGVIASSSDESRSILMTERLRTLANTPSRERIPQMKAMAEGINSLSEELKSNLLMTQMTVLSELDPKLRKIMMRSMDTVNKLIEDNNKN